MKARLCALALALAALSACGSTANDGTTAHAKSKPTVPAIWSPLGKARTIHDGGTTLSVTASKPNQHGTQGGDREVTVWLAVKNTGSKTFDVDFSTYLSLYTGGLAGWDNGEDTPTTNHTATYGGPRPVMLGGTIKPGQTMSGWATFLLEAGTSQYVLDWDSTPTFKPLALWTLQP